MTVVKGSRQYQMVVVPHRPLKRFFGLMVSIAVAIGIAYLCYLYGRQEGLALEDEVVRERDAIRKNLEHNKKVADSLRQEIAGLKLGVEVDSRVNEEVILTVEDLQNRIADQQEEIGFYKGVMLPNVDKQGLRIERLRLVNGLEPNSVRYSLLLTQVVEKHDFVQGGVEISVIGRSGDQQQSFNLREVSEREDEIRFRFRYFQNIDGEMVLPSNFVPKEIMVVAESTGRANQRLERRFDWQPSGG